MKNNYLFLNFLSKVFSFNRNHYLLSRISFVLLIFFGIPNTNNCFGQTSQTYTSDDTFIVPNGVTSITAQCIGAGGAGGSGRGISARGAGGGAGGQFATSTFSVTSGQSLNIKVAGITLAPSNSNNTDGANGDYSQVYSGATIYVRAMGGQGGIRANDSRAGGTGNTTGGIGDIVYRGGHGGNGTTLASGGGGGGAGTTGNGGNATGITAGSGTTLYGGNGGAGRDTSGNGNNGSNYGGGGSGGRRSNNGGNGAQGYVVITYTCPVLTANAGPDQTLASCSTTTTLNATIPSIGNGTWTIISGTATISSPNSPTSSISGIVPGTPVTLRWTVDNGICGNAFDDVIITSPIGSACLNYCDAGGTNNRAGFISNVTLNTINRNSGWDGYINTGLNTVLTKGASYPLSINIFAYDASANEYSAVWIDWNNDGDFADAGEMVMNRQITNASSITRTSTVNVPLTAVSGTTRMRVIFKHALNIKTDGCDTDIIYMDAEDYLVTIGENTSCTGSPNGGSITSVNPSSAWPSTPYTVTATGFTTASNMSYQWQYSIDNGVTWINAGGATSSYSDYNAIAPNSGQVLWQLTVTCNNSGMSSTSNIGVFTTNSVSNIATGCASVDAGGLGLNGADLNPFFCYDTLSCVDLEANYLDLGNTTSYSVEAIAYNPPHNFSGLANPISVNIDDIWSPIINLPFNFCFYGNSYNSCIVGSNGILSFETFRANTGSGYVFNDNLPSNGTGMFANAIYGVYQDIDPSVGGEVGWELVTLSSGCRALVVSWFEVPMYSDHTLTYTGMMVLYENSNIIEVFIKEKHVDDYNVGPWNNGNGIVGMQNSSRTIATVAPNRNGLDPNWNTSYEAWRFVPNGSSLTSLTWHEGSGITGPVIGTGDILNVCPTETTTYTAEVTYSLCNGTTLTEIDETTVTINKSKTWNGSISSDWNNGNNWTPAGIPTAMDCVVIPDTANDPIISGSGYNGLGLNMSIQNDAMLTVNSNNSVTITDWVNISTTGELFLDNAASLVQVNNIANSGAGIMRMERDVNIKRLDYVYWSSPVTSFSSSLISTGTPTNLIWKWTPTVPGKGIGNSGDWVNGNETMTLGKGYIVRGPSSYTTTPQNFTATFVGTPNNGNISLPIYRGTYTSAATYQVCATCTPATALDDNWNLVGNPYPSAIDANDFMTSNTNIDGYIKLWTHGTLPDSATADPFYEGFVYNYTISDYITYNHLGTLPSPDGFDGYIAAGQGFFVSMLDGGPATQNLNFTNALRSNTYDNGQFYRNTNNSVASNEKHRIWLDIVNTTNNSSMTALIGYADGASNSRDRLYDAETDNKVTLNLFSLIDDVKFAIQGRQTPFDDNDVVPLGFRAPSNGIYSIGIKSIDGLFETTAQAIFLHDLELNIIHDLRSMPYSFQANEGTNNNRFNLIFKNTLSENTTELNDNSVWVSSSTGLTVHSSIENISSIKVFDILGRVLSNKEKVTSKTIVLDQILKTNSGLILEITLQNNKVLYKKVVY